MEIEFTQLFQAIAEAFTIHGVDATRAGLLAKELTEATFAGYESHGLGRVKSYVKALQEGRLNPAASLQIVRETPSTALLDADKGIGVLMALEAAGIAAKKARDTGVSAITVRNCGDVARLAPYAERIATAGLIGIVMANDAGGGLAVVPHGGVKPLFSTNPIAAGIPRASGKPVVFDLATSQVAVGSIRAAARRKAVAPEDTLMGRDGALVTDPVAFFSGLASLLPLGGLAFGFKGTALALLVDVLAGGLSGDGLSGESPERELRNALFMLAINPSAFVDQSAFEHRVEALLSRIRATEARPGAPSPRVPGEHACDHETPAPIEIHEGLWNELSTLIAAR